MALPAHPALHSQINFQEQEANRMPKTAQAQVQALVRGILLLSMPGHQRPIYQLPVARDRRPSARVPVVGRAAGALGAMNVELAELSFELAQVSAQMTTSPRLQGKSEQEGGGHHRRYEHCSGFI